MAVLALSLLGLVAVVCGGIPRRGARNFPLDGCSTDEIDFMFLYYDFTDNTNYWFQTVVAHTFAEDVVASNGTAGRVQFAGVFDTFSLKEPQVDVTSWRFNESIQPIEYDGLRSRKLDYYNINKTIPLKIQFVKRLFAEMGGVRQNATQVAVVFLYGQDLSFEESRSVPDIVQQQDTEIKIFVVLFGAKFEENVVYLRDTLIVGYYRILFSYQTLTMAICNRCSEGWFLYKPKNPKDALSCYLLSDSNAVVSWRDVWRECVVYQVNFIATVETEEKLHFLKKQLSTYLQQRERPSLGPDGTSVYSARIAIGLERDTTTLAKRFYWNYFRLKNRPLVVNHWLPGEPSGGSRRGCGSWQFDWNRTNDGGTSLAGDGGGLVDGWVSVGCEEVSNDFGLCEVLLPRRDEVKTELRIKSATNESYNHALAKGNLRLFKGNLVSVSANVGNDEFQNQEVNEPFPLFDCGEGIPAPRYISYLFVCDGVDQCSNRRDEMLCAVRSQEATENKKGLAPTCSGVYCGDGSCLPLQWVNDGEVDCDVLASVGEKVGNDEDRIINKYLKGNVSCAFICNDDQCVHFSQLNDSVVDCKGQDGPLDETLGKLERADTCQNILGHPIWAPRCVYVRDRYGAVLGCRDLSHVKGCTDFECPEGYFKCPDTYCIPQHYVLNGHGDCPAGEEENFATISPCTGNFACWDSKVCLHPDLVCDGHPDCPHQDDEVDCHVTCPAGLRCISGTVTVSDYSQTLSVTDAVKLDRRSRYLNLSGASLAYDTLLYYIKQLRKATSLILSHCSIHGLDIQFFFYTKNIQDLDISYNLLQNLDDMQDFESPLKSIRLFNLSYNKELVNVNVFYKKLKWLETLDLAHTGVFQLEEMFHDSFPSLKHLNLSFTKITNIHKNPFPSRLILLTLDLRGLALKDFREHFFNGLTVRQDLYTDSFELCCPQIRGSKIPDHVCHAPDDAISSCYDLVGVDVQRVLLWVVAVLAVLGNMTVIVYRVIWDRSVLRTGYGLFVINLGISDFIMGVYLFIIAGADYYYRGVYVLFDKTWRESDLCRLAGFLATLSCETSTFFVFLITLDRFLVMKFPFGQIKLNEASKMVIVVMSWIIGFLLALTPIVFRFEIYSSNAMCLGLPLTTEQLIGWEFSFAVFIVLNFCIFLPIVYGQRAIFRAMSENRQSQTASRRAQDITVAKQLSLVALSNFLCWFPVGLMGLLSLSGHEISNDVYAWTTVIVLPINSAANPLLYTIPVLMSKWETFKHGPTRSRETSTQ